MKINELNIFEKSHYYKDSDIFNLRPPKTPESFKLKPLSLNLTNKNNNHRYNYLNNSNNEDYFLNKKDNVKECLRDKNYLKNYINRYKKYKTVENLKKESKKFQLNKSYEYNYDENNKIYKNIRLNNRKGNLIFGNYTPTFSSEYNSMQDYAKKILLSKRIYKGKKNILNKSMDVPMKFKPLKRQNFKRKNRLNELYNQNSIDIDLNKSCDNIILNKRKKHKIKNSLDFYKSNIFFDKEKMINNEKLDRYSDYNKIRRRYEKLNNNKISKNKLHSNIIRKKTNFYFEERPDKIPHNTEELKQFFRDGNFPLPYSNYKPHKEIILSSLDDIYNSKNKKLYQGLTEMERNVDKFIILGIDKNNKFDEFEIKNLFAKNGLHMFGEQTYGSYIENGKKGKFVFNIRKDLKDRNYNKKMKKIQNILYKRQGIKFNIDNRRMNYNKKRRKDISPIPFKNKKGDEDVFI